MEQVSVYVDESVARRDAGRRKVAIYLALAVLLTAATLVAVNGTGSSVRSLSTRAADKAGNVVPQSTGCTKTFTNPGPPALTACVSGHGNVNQIDYSPFGNGADQIASEGYCLADLDADTRFYDAGSAEAGWGVATQTSTATTATTTRTTTNGRYTLTQNFFFKYGSRLLLIGNLVKNNDTVAHTVVFERIFDADMNGSAGGDVYDQAGTSLLAQETDGLASTLLGDPSLSNGFGVETYANYLLYQADCGYVPVTTPTPPGDYVGLVIMRATIAPGATVNFRTGYRLL